MVRWCWPISRKMIATGHILVGAAIIWAACVTATSIPYGFDYCGTVVCGKTHIACNNSGSFGEHCPPDVRTVDMKIYKEDILSWYNKLRDSVASGKVPGLQPAVRMAIMQWDDELEYMAKLNAKRCRLKGDKCHATQRFVYSGQNSGLFSFKPAKYSDLEILELRTYTWLRGVQKLNMDIINKYPKDIRDPAIGRVTVAINEHNNYIGCAATKFVLRSQERMLFVCNYATTNLIGDPVYTAGDKPASKCAKTDKKYLNLCDANEIYRNDVL